MRVFTEAKVVPGRTLALTLREGGEFLFRETLGTAPDGKVTDYEGTYDERRGALTLNCQFEVEARMTEAAEVEATAIRRRCRDVFHATLDANCVRVSWKDRTEELVAG